jgi:hypothetical protein
VLLIDYSGSQLPFINTSIMAAKALERSTKSHQIARTKPGSLRVILWIALPGEGRVVTEPRAVATGCYIQPAIDHFVGRKHVGPS